MGAVYLAEHVLMHKTVALKVLHREMTVHPEVVARFEREAVAAARIDHPNVAAAMDFGRLADGSCYLVLEYVGGQSLRELLGAGPIEPVRALALGRQIAHGLAAAHAAGIVHRDLKPDNVMLVPQADGGDLVKVLDFGIAKMDGAGEEPASGRQLTRIGTVIGTAGYMAPEQALGQAVDHRVDLYAFGVVLYEMIAGRIPFDAEEVTQILARQLTEPVPPLPEGTPPELSALIAHLLEKSAGDRVQSIAEVVERIDRILLGPAPGGSIGPVVAAAVSARTAPGVETGATELHLPAPVESAHAAQAAQDKRRAIAAGAALLAVLFGGTFLWRARSTEPAPGAAAAPSAEAAPSASAAGPVASAPPAMAPPAARASASAAPPRILPENGTTVTQTKTTTQTGGRTTRTTRRTSTTTSREEKTETRPKRRTGPGGIYIPPPSQWFN
jgi:serine/threonine-protein kinase